MERYRRPGQRRRHGIRLATIGTYVAPGHRAGSGATAEQGSGIDTILRVPVRIATDSGLPTPDAFWCSPAAFGYVMNHIQEGVPDREAANLVTAIQSAIGPR